MLRVRYQLLLLTFLVLGVYYAVIFAPFCSTDDVRMIESLANAESFDIFQLFFPHGAAQYYRPLLYLTFIADKYAWGLDESFMHLENLVLHLCNVLLVFACARMLFKTWKVDAGPWAPLVAALIFALHPINTEAVDWVSGRTDLLAGCFVLLSLWFLAASLHGRSAAAAVLSGAALLLGALSKEPALCFAPAALVLVICHDLRFGAGLGWRERLRTMLVPVLAVLASAATYLVMRAWALSASDKGVAQVVRVGTAPTADLLNLTRVCVKLTGFYLKKLFLPLPLNFAIVDVANYYVVPGALFLALLCYLLYRRTLPGLLAIAGFCILAPAFLLAVSPLSWTPVAERYLYIPCAMFSIVVAMLGVSCYRRLNGRPVLAVAVCAFLLGGSAYATASRNVVWQDNYTLFADTARKSPSFTTAKNDMAVALYNRGNKEEAYRMFEALSVDKFQSASLNVARVYMAKGDLVKARVLLYDRLKDDRGYRPDILKALVKIAELRRAETSDPQAARALNEEMLQLITQQYQITKDPFYRYRMGLVYLKLDKRDLAYDCFSKAGSAASAGSHYRQAALHLAEKYRR